MSADLAYEVASFGLQVALGVLLFRYISDRLDREPGYFSRDVDGVERWFCEVCGKEEGACARCEEVVV